MRTCTNCGAQFPDDELICPVCGQEVQLVPDYVTIESHIQEDEFRKQEEEKKKREEEERQAEIEARKKEIRRNVTLFIILAAAGVIAVIAFISLAKANKNAGSFEYQFEHADAAYESGDYESAMDFVTQALKLEPDSEDALLLEAEIYIGMGEEDSAIPVLEGIISGNDGNTRAYEELIGIYEKRNDTDSIISLLSGCSNDDVLNEYAGYLVKTPVISPDGGDYEDEFPEVTITTEGTGSIYYTTDGSDPTASSSLYTKPFALGEGSTTVKAVSISDSGVTSDIASADFSVTLKTPAAPKISPASGRYEHMTGSDEDDSSDGETGSVSSSSEDDSDVSEITVEVPDGYTCYYAFDEKPTEKSSVYKKPVKMKEGEHVFYAVLQSSTGKLGKVASATYVYAEVTPTPTPTATPKATATPVPSSISANTVVTPTATPTPTETPTPTPTSTPTATPEPTTEPADSSSGSSTADSTASQ